jgi:short subunit fatty acids transporter
MGRRVRRTVFDVVLLLSWSFSLIFSALLAREVANRFAVLTIAQSVRQRISAWAVSGLSGFLRPLRFDGERRVTAGIAEGNQRSYSDRSDAWLVAGNAHAAVLIVVSMVISYYSHPAADRLAR